MSKLETTVRNELDAQIQMAEDHLFALRLQALLNAQDNSADSKASREKGLTPETTASASSTTRNGSSGPGASGPGASNPAASASITSSGTCASNGPTFAGPGPGPGSDQAPKAHKEVRFTNSVMDRDYKKCSEVFHTTAEIRAADLYERVRDHADFNFFKELDARIDALKGPSLSHELAIANPATNERLRCKRERADLKQRIKDFCLLILTSGGPRTISIARRPGREKSLHDKILDIIEKLSLEHSFWNLEKEIKPRPCAN